MGIWHDNFSNQGQVPPSSTIDIAGSSIGISAESYGNAQAYGLYDNSQSSTKLTAANSISIISNTLSGNTYGIYGSNSSEITLSTNSAESLISIDSLSDNGSSYGIYGLNKSQIALDAYNIDVSANKTISNNSENQSEDLALYGTGTAILSSSQASIELSSTSVNNIRGAVEVLGNSSTTAETSVSLAGDINRIRSFTVITGAGDLNQDANEDPDKNFKNKSIISALYAEGSDAHIRLTGRNQIFTYADNTNEQQLERTVWAYDGALIELDGWSYISTNRYETSPNSLDVAIAAGTAVNLTPETVAEPVPDFEMSVVSVTYENDGSNLSQITGDILAAYAGTVDITAKNDSAGLIVTGNLLAGNGGKLNLELGANGMLVGRTDSYMDAGATEDSGHTTFFNPAFSSEIYEGGEVALDMGTGSTWYVTGQSWITSLSGNSTIQLVEDRTTADDASIGSHALHVENLSGRHTFVVNLDDTNHGLSDMLYIDNVEEGSETQVVRINSLDGLENMADQDRIRFATVNASAANLTFVAEEGVEAGSSEFAARAMVRDVGFFDVGFRIESETRATDTTDINDYDGESFDATKPGEAYVDEYYGSNTEDAQNWYLVRDKSGDTTSDAGEAVLATARAAYWSAVEIDRLNKRLGDARHAEGGTEGFWVRVRNDRIGTSAGMGDFRSRNYAYQFGYDHSKLEEDGNRLFGVALDYMDGNTSYKDVDGTGATDRFGVTAYMTWLGDDGWYYDIVGKWGVLSNSFRITNGSGSLVEADYDNHVLGASFEFGRKLTKEDSLWFLEPQAQIQHVMVTEASYGTSQGTRVDQDKINSTITRLGFRFGRNFGEQANGLFYAKADWLKEWHGHQKITVTDITTGNVGADASLDNKGNWFDVGLGIQSPISKTTYFFADAEYVFGNNFENTWNFNAGVRWMFH